MHELLIVALMSPLSSGDSCCVWSVCSELVAYVHEYGQYTLVDTSTGQSCSGQMHGPIVYWEAQFLPNQTLLLLSRTAPCSVVSLGRDGSLTQLNLNLDFGFDCKVFVSPHGAIAYTRHQQLFGIWQAGAELVEVPLSGWISSVAWSPCATLMLCSVEQSSRSLAFVSAQGQVVSRQQLVLYSGATGGLFWGRYGVLSAAHCHMGCTGVWYFTVEPGYRLQLQHSFRLPVTYHNRLRFSQDQAHYCFVADARVRVLIVLPASPAQAQLQDWTRVCWPATNLNSEPLWLSDGSAILDAAHYQRTGWQNSRSLLRFMQL